jgi:hypothetical protein
VRRTAVTWRYRADVAGRTVAALGGGYLLAALLAVACAWTVPGTRIDAAAFGTIAGFLAWPVAAMGCFWARSAWRAWAGLIVFAAPVAAVALVGGWRP